MSQRGIFKILNRKDGKGIVTNAKDDDEVKVTSARIYACNKTTGCQGRKNHTLYAQYRPWIGLLAPGNTRKKNDRI